LRQFIEAGRQAIEQGNLHAALFIALTMPDICGSLETPNAGNGERYRRWVTKWVEPRFIVNYGSPPAATRFITADELWNARNSIIHSGKSEMRSGATQLKNIFFFDDSIDSHLNRYRINGRSLLQVRTSDFCAEIWLAAEDWLAATSGDKEIAGALNDLLTIRAPGYSSDGIVFG